MKRLGLIFLFFVGIIVQIQSQTEVTPEHDVMQIVNQFGRYIQAKDSLQIAHISSSNMAIALAYLNADSLQILGDQFNDLFAHSWLEKKYQYVPQVDIRSSFAMVYGYFIAKDTTGMVKCGTDHYQLIKLNGTWKVFEFSETVYDECKTIKGKNQELKEINKTLNTWHGLGAVGDTSYFDYFAGGSFYLGTDPKEVWSIEAFKNFALPYFRRGSAWSFKNKSRNVHLGDYGHYAWFDEKLDTWMGLCRGTGVMEKQVDGWRIKHYSLTVLVPNSKIKEYVKMINPQ